MTAPAAASKSRPAKAAKPDAAPKPDGAKLYKALLASARRARLGGELVEHKNGLYTRLQVGGKTVAYVVRGKTAATVYPGTLASAMPSDVKFRKVELGAHHYGRGEVVVSVASEGEIENAVAALKASVAAPPAIEKKAKAAEAA